MELLSRRLWLLLWKVPKFQCAEMYEVRCGYARKDLDQISQRLKSSLNYAKVNKAGAFLELQLVWLVERKKKNFLLMNIHIYREKTNESALLPDYCRPGRHSAGW